MSEAKLKEILLALLRTGSVTGNEMQICSEVEEQIARQAPLAKTVRAGNSLFTYGPFDSAKKTIAFFGHLDTVPGMNDVSCEGNVVRGLGSSDMKAGVAVMLGLLEDETLRSSRFNVIYCFYDREEGPYPLNGLHKVLASCEKELRTIDLAFFLEPTNNQFQLGCMGLLNVELKFQGKRAHSARPWEGKNAIYSSLPFLSRVSALQPTEIKAGTLIFKELMVVTKANGGIAGNVIPDVFTLHLNVRFGPGTSLVEARKRVEQLVQGEALIDIIDEAPSGAIPYGNEVFEEFRKRYPLPEAPKQAYTDVAFLSQLGIAAMNFGPGLTAQAHQAGEYVLLSDIVKSYEMFKAFLGDSVCDIPGFVDRN